MEHRSNLKLVRVEKTISISPTVICTSELKSRKLTEKNLEAADNVGPVNNFLHSLFSQVDVSLNGVLITNSSNTYGYRAYIENLLSYGSLAKKSLN
jgi:hypothetical protein